MPDRQFPAFLPGDVILCSSWGDLPGRLGLWIARARGEAPTYAVHGAQFLDAHTVLEMNVIARVRAAEEVLTGGRALEVWRCTTLTPRQRTALTRHAVAYRNTKFGWTKLFTHALDDLINKVARREVFFFRRLNHNQRYPLCSWITAFSYHYALHYDFGTPPECADPDQIHDWVCAHPGEWQRILKLAPSRQRAARGRRPLVVSR